MGAAVRCSRDKGGEYMTIEEQKLRTRRLIELGGLVRVSGLDKLDKGELTGLLVHSHNVHQGLTQEARSALRITGWAFLRQRKKDKNPAK